MAPDAPWASRRMGASGSITPPHPILPGSAGTTAGQVVHIAVGHSFEGNHMGVSAECMIVRQADHGWWHLAGALGLIVPGSGDGLAGNLRARN